jgi:hypothetical protein
MNVSLIHIHILPIWYPIHANKPNIHAQCILFIFYALSSIAEVR